MNSSYYVQKKREFESIKSTINRLVQSLDNLLTLVSNAQIEASSVMIAGSSIDDGKLKELLAFLLKINVNLRAIIIECNLKIPLYESLYRDAYAKEIAAKRAKEETNEVT